MLVVERAASARARQRRRRAVDAAARVAGATVLPAARMRAAAPPAGPAGRHIDRSQPARYAFLAALAAGSEYVAAPVLVDGAVVGFLHGDRARGPARAGAARLPTRWSTSPRASRSCSSAPSCAGACATSAARSAVSRRGRRRGRASSATARSTCRPNAAEEVDHRAPAPEMLTEDGVTAHLTTREVDVLRLMADGKTNGDIARALFVSEGTVKFHVKNILRKMQASNRADASSRYLRLTMHEPVRRPRLPPFGRARPPPREVCAAAVADHAAPMPITVVGSIAFDTVATPFGRRERMVGGAATHFALAASFFDEVRVVGPVGDDFDAPARAVLATRGTNTDDVEHVAGGNELLLGRRVRLGPQLARDARHAARRLRGLPAEAQRARRATPRCCSSRTSSPRCSARCSSSASARGSSRSTR